MADKKISEDTELTTPGTTHYFPVIDASLLVTDPANANKKLSYSNLKKTLGVQGGVYDALDYGAKGDGVTDDTAAINSAITAARAGVGGGRVTFPHGTYIVSSQIKVPSYVSLEGNGSPEACVIKASGSFPINTALVQLGDPAILAGFNFGMYFKNLTVDCNNIAGSIGIQSTQMNETCSIFNVVINHYMATGISISSGNAQNWYIQDVWILSAAAATACTGILLRAVPSRVSIRGVTLVTQGANVSTLPGIDLQTTTGCVFIEGCHIESHQIGILVGNDTANYGQAVIFNVVGYSNMATLVKLSNFAISCVLGGLDKYSATNILIDNTNGVTLTQATLPFYCQGSGGVGANNYFNPTGKSVLGGQTLFPAIAARAYNSVNLSINNATPTALTFDSERFDTDGIHSTASNTGRLTCVTAGKYVITGHVQFDNNATGFRTISIRLNAGATIIAAQASNAVNGDSTNLSITVIYDLATNDYVQLYVYQNSGVALNVVASANFGCEFEMAMVGT